MTHFLISDENPQGHKLEDILSVIRKDIFYRSTKILDDNRPEARSVLENNVKILSLLGEAIDLAEQSTQLLDRSFGKGNDDGPRIGKN